MPTYDYVCRACGHELELFQAITARPKRKCPRCSRNSLERRIGTGAAILFRGSGFYQTDYRSDAYTKAHKAETSTGEGKPAADTPTKQPDKPGVSGKPAKADDAA